MLDGMRRQRAAYVRVPTDALRARFRGVAFFMSGGNSQGDESSHQESGLSAAPKSSRRPRLERRRLRGTAVATPSPPARGGGVGPPADRKVGKRWRHVWSARQHRLPLFAVLRLDARLAHVAASLLLDAAEAEPAARARVGPPFFESARRARLGECGFARREQLRGRCMYVLTCNASSERKDPLAR